MGVSLNLVPEATDIIRAAPALAADPPPDGLRIGRDMRGRPVVVVVHADRWSLGLRPAGRCGRTATSAVFLDGYGAGFGLTFIDVTFDHDPSLLGDEWADMVGHVLSIAT